MTEPAAAAVGASKGAGMNVERLDSPRLIDPARLSAAAERWSVVPGQWETLDHSRQSLLAHPVDRERLATALDAYNRELGNDGLALANIAALRHPATTVVVTGQQPGLFTGPLYTIYKAVTAINLARALTARFSHPVVPVFWNATEDHDLSEIAACRHPAKVWQADFPATGVAAERLPTAPACAAVTAAYVAQAAEPYRADLARLLRCEHADYGRHSSAVIARLFQGTGLVLLEPRLLRGLHPDFAARCVRDRHAIRAALAAGAAALRALGWEPSLEPRDGFGLFFINGQGVRRQVLERPDGYLLDGNHATEAELRRRIAATPADFSTGVYLRPLLQGLALPVLAYVAGPGEFQYHLQLPELFRQFDVPLPALHLRNHATILGPAEQRLAAKLGLGSADCVSGPGQARLRGELPVPIATAFADATAHLEQAAAAVRQAAGDLLGDRALGAFRHNVAAELDKLDTRARREHQRQQEVDNARVDRFYAAVRPGGELQERRLNLFYFLEACGPGLIADLLAVLDPFEPRHYLLRTTAPVGAA